MVMTTPDDRHPPAEFKKVALAQVLKNLMALWRARRNQSQETATQRLENS